MKVFKSFCNHLTRICIYNIIWLIIIFINNESKFFQLILYSINKSIHSIHLMRNPINLINLTFLLWFLKKNLWLSYYFLNLLFLSFFPFLISAVFRQFIFLYFRKKTWFFWIIMFFLFWLQTTYLLRVVFLFLLIFT